MRGRRGVWCQGVVALGALVGWGVSSCEAQFSPAGGPSNEFVTGGMSGMTFPQFPQQGDWAEVLTVTPKWIVIQNQQGQQFPVSLAGVQLFVMRWPAALDAITPGALVEATGLDIGTNQVQTDHVDVYEGTANQLGVAPTMQMIVGMNRVISQWDIDSWVNYGVDLYRYLSPDEMNMPRRIHVVAPMVDINPLRLAIGGGIALTVVPPSLATFFVTSITPGSTSFVRRGDLVYFLPQEATPKSLNLTQLIVYKNVALKKFVP